MAFTIIEQEPATQLVRIAIGDNQAALKNSFNMRVTAEERKFLSRLTLEFWNVCIVNHENKSVPRLMVVDLEDTPT